jgi:hypothetical protein
MLANITAGATTANDAVTVLENPNGVPIRHLHVWNGAVAGWLLIDGIPARLIANVANMELDLTHCPTVGSIQIQRIADGSDMADVWMIAT